MSASNKTVSIDAHALGVSVDPDACKMCDLHWIQERQQRALIVELDRQFVLLRAKLEREKRMLGLWRTWAYAGWGVAIIALLAAIR